MAFPRTSVLAKIVIGPEGPVTEKLTASVCNACVLPAMTPVRVAPAGLNPASVATARLTWNELVTEAGRKLSSPSKNALIV